MSAQSKILIVDDDPDIRKVLRLLLQALYKISEAADGDEAVRLIQEQKDTDLIILDVMMPGMDGYATCDALRAYTNAPVLFLTAKSAESDRISAYRSGGDDFLSKPFSQDELLAKVSSLLRRYREYRGKPDAALAIENPYAEQARHQKAQTSQKVPASVHFLDLCLHRRDPCGK